MVPLHVPFDHPLLHQPNGPSKRAERLAGNAFELGTFDPGYDSAAYTRAVLRFKWSPDLQSNLGCLAILAPVIVVLFSQNGKEHLYFLEPIQEAVVAAFRKHLSGFP